MKGFRLLNPLLTLHNKCLICSIFRECIKEAARFGAATSRSVGQKESRTVSRPWSVASSRQFPLKISFDACRMAPTKDSFQLQQNRFCRTKNRSGTPDLFLAQNVETFHTRSISTTAKSFLVCQRSFWYTRFVSGTEC